MKIFFTKSMGLAVGLSLTASLAVSQQLEEILVTAQKRVETAQDVPLAILPITGETFAREGVRDLRDIVKMSTELEVDFNSNSATVIGIRGVQQSAWGPTDESTNSVYIDGAAMPGMWGLNGVMWDIERMEVLSGPQGTLYGRNSASGAVSIIRNRPGTEFAGNVLAELGNYNLQRIEAGVDVPVSDRLALRFAGQHHTRDGYYKSGYDDADQRGIRMAAVFSLTDVSELLFTLDYTEYGGAGGGENVIANPMGAVYGPGHTYQGLQIIVPSNRFDDRAWLGRNDTRPGSGINQDGWGALLQYEHDFSTVTLTAIYGHREFDGINITGTGSFTPIDAKNDTLEIRLTSTDVESSIEWVTGVYYAQAENNGWTGTPVPVGHPLCNLVGPCTGTGAPFIFAFEPTNNETESWAVFGQGTWTPENLERLHLTAGLRYAYDHNSADIGSWGAGIQYFTLQESNSGNNVDYKLGAQWDLTESAIVYGSIATGYKAGGYAFGPTPRYEPEELLAYELGIKSRNSAGTVQFNASAWMYDYKNFQTTVQVPLEPQYQYINPANGQLVTTAVSVSSAGKAEMLGATMDLQWLFTANDMLAIQATYLESEYTDGLLEVAPNVFDDRTGLQFGNAPKWNLIGRYSHTYDLPSGAGIDTGVKVQRVGDRINYTTTGQTVLPAYTITDLSIRYMGASGQWDITGYVNNAFDENAIRTQAINATSGLVTGTYYAPRTFGAILNYRF